MAKAEYEAKCLSHFQQLVARLMEPSTQQSACQDLGLPKEFLVGMTAQQLLYNTGISSEKDSSLKKLICFSSSDLGATRLLNELN